MGFALQHYTVLYANKVTEVIYPQVPLRIPCYDLAPLTKP
jgi:hypothetical protein